MFPVLLIFALLNIQSCFTNHKIALQESVLSPNGLGVQPLFCGVHFMKNLVGQKFNYLTVIGAVEKRPRKGGSYDYYCLCKCDCGNEKVVGIRHLIYNHVQTCGCNLARIKHGMSRTRIYNVWRGMIRRCYDRKSTSYPYYGANGITVCDEWLNSFEAFRDFAIANGYTDELTIDRHPNNDGNYGPTNVRFATQAENSRNSAQTKLSWTEVRKIRADFGPGIKKTLLAKKFHVSATTIGYILSNKTWND